MQHQRDFINSLPTATFRPSRLIPNDTTKFYRYEATVHTQKERQAAWKELYLNGHSLLHIAKLANAPLVEVAKVIGNLVRPKKDKLTTTSLIRKKQCLPCPEEKGKSYLPAGEVTTRKSVLVDKPSTLEQESMKTVG